MSKKKFYILVAVVVFVYLFFIFFVLKIFSPTPVPAPTPNPIEQSVTPVSEDADLLNILKAEEIIDKLPYRGKYFELSYDLKRGVFLLVIDPSHKNEGGIEFNDYLKQNGYKSASELINLETNHKALSQPNPEP